MRRTMKTLISSTTVLALVISMLTIANFSSSADAVVFGDYAENTWYYNFTMGVNAFSDTGTIKRNVSEISDNYIFHNASNQAVSGYVIIEFSKPISDYNIVTGEAVGNVNGNLTYAWSSDGTNYTGFTPEKEINTAAGMSLSSDWNAYYYNNYGTFDISDGVKYIKINLNPTGSMAKLPFFRFMLYNYAPLPPVPSWTAHTWDYGFTMGVNAFSDAGTINRGISEIEDNYIFHNGSNQAVPGYVIMEFDKPLSNYIIVTGENNNNSSGSITYEYSSDGTNYTGFTPYKDISTISSGLSGVWGANYFDNYGTFQLSDGVKYIKVKLNPNGSFPKLPFFRFMLYDFYNVTEVDVAFNTNSSETIPNQKAYVGYAVGTLPVPAPRYGYVFDGWYDSGYTTAYTDAYVVPGAMTMYAKWTDKRQALVDGVKDILLKNPTTPAAIFAAEYLGGDIDIRTILSLKQSLLQP